MLASRAARGAWVPSGRARMAWRGVRRVADAAREFFDIRYIFLCFLFLKNFHLDDQIFSHLSLYLYKKVDYFLDQCKHICNTCSYLSHYLNLR